MRWFTSCLPVALLAACVPAAELHLFNNLPVAVVATTCDASVAIPPGTAAVLNTVGCAWGSDQLVVKQPGAEWRYSGLMYSATWLFQRNPEFAKSKFPNSYQVRAQLEPSGAIFFIKPGVPTPTKDLADALRISPVAAGSEG
jgi:hypothetical protein